MGGESRFQGFDKISFGSLIPVIKKYCELLYSRYQERLEGVILFGSFAKGGGWNSDSDTDLAVVGTGWERSRIWERIKELSPLKLQLEHTPEFSDCVRNGFLPSISHLAMTKDDLERFKTIYLDLAFDGIVLYDKSGEMKTFIIDSVKARARDFSIRKVMLAGCSIMWELGQE